MTPLTKYGNVYLKREDLNITGSAKDRAIRSQLTNLKQHDFKSAVVSSSGNAAISAEYYCRQENIPLTIFVSSKIHPNKLKYLNSYHSTNQPISDAFKYAKRTHSYYLRQSTDPSAINGYSEISVELQKQLPEITSIFIPVGSGTTLMGISSKLPKNVKIYAVQPASFCPIASVSDRDYVIENTTITDSLSVKMIPLKNKVLSAITRGIVVQNEEVLKQIDLLSMASIITSAEGAMALAGYEKIKNQEDIGEFPVILLTGAKR